MAKRKIELMGTKALEDLRDKAIIHDNWALIDRCDAELDRREYDASDPASPQNTHEYV